MDPIFVTGATGNIGGVVARALLRRGRSVRVAVRRLDARSAALAEAGAEVVVADLFDPEAMTSAMRGTASAFFLPPMDPYMIQAATVFAVAAKRARVRGVVVLSQWLASPSNPSLLTRQHWLADELFALLPGIAHVTVNPGFFAHNYLGYNLLEGAVHLGVYANAYGASRNAPPSNEDIAAVVVEALLDTGRHDGRVYRPTGPELLTPHEIAATIGRVANRPVRAVDVPVVAFKAAMRSVGVPLFVQESILTYRQEALSGSFAVGAPTTHVLDVTGRPAESMEATVRRYCEAPSSQRTAANRLRAFADFMKIGVSLPADLDRYVRSQAFPTPRGLHLSSQSPAWRSVHEFMAATATVPGAASASSDLAAELSR